VDFTLYLPDEIAGRAKAAQAEGLNLSRLFRDAVTHELDRRDAMSAALMDAQKIELEVKDVQGRPYIVRFTGRILATDQSSERKREVVVYLVREAVLVYDSGNLQLHELKNPVEELASWVDQPSYFDAMHAIGQTPVVELDV
jgi:predicted transcriptional regulator